jgi:hypothetical protein
MLVQVTPESTPDFAASNWLKFSGCCSMPGDPTSYQQFSTVYAFLTAITYHFTEVAGPWFAVTPQEIIEVHSDYLRWCNAITQFGDSYSAPKPIPFSLQNLAALSHRRMQALEQFGGTEREDYPIYSHLHKIITLAAHSESHGRQRWLSGINQWQKLHVTTPIPHYFF